MGGPSPQHSITLKRTRVGKKWQASMSRLRDRQAERRQAALKVISCGGSFADAAEKSGLSVSTIRQRFPRHLFDQTSVEGHTFRDQEGKVWKSLILLAREHRLSLNGVRTAVERKNIRVWIRTTNLSGHRAYAREEEFNRVYLDEEQTKRSRLRKTIGEIIDQAQEHLAVVRFPGVSEFQMAVYIALALWKIHHGGHNPTRCQLLEALNLRPNQVDRVGKALRALEEKGHLDRVRLRSQRSHFIYMITTPRTLAPMQLTRLVAPKSGEEVDLPWYRPNSNGTAH